MTEAEKQRGVLWIAIAVGVIVLLVRVATMPRTPWELDEILFMQGVVDYEPLAHHPHPPGYPVTVALGKLFTLFGLTPFLALVVVSLISSAVGAGALVFAFCVMLRSRAGAVAAALLFHLSPAMLVHGPLALSDPPAMMFLSLALAMLPVERDTSATRVALFAAFMSLSIGCRPQWAVALVPAFFLALAISRSWKRALVALAAFTVASLAWMVPLVIETGGVAGFLDYELRQAGYVAAHDAAVSRSGRTTAEIALRFIAHPWGTKLASIPLLLLALVGLLRWKRMNWKAALPIVTITAIQTAFCLATADPADGVRYVLPALVGVAALAANAVAPSAMMSGAVALLFAAGSIVYAWPVLLPRTTTPSPPSQAASHARTLPDDAVVLYSTALKPHAEWMFGKKTMPIDTGLQELADDSATPLFLFVEGRSSAAGARTFAWPESDAYDKLTRAHYRVVSLVPVPPHLRFSGVSGVFGLERTTSGVEWRWLAQRAALEIPDLDAQTLRLTVALPPESALERNRVTARFGDESATTEVRRGETSTLTLPLGRDGGRVEIFAERASVPGSADELNRDPRRLAVQLRRVEQE